MILDSEDLPPPYTPLPTPGGEQTLSYGPTRPFQNAQQQEQQERAGGGMRAWLERSRGAQTLARGIGTSLGAGRGRGRGRGTVDRSRGWDSARRERRHSVPASTPAPRHAIPRRALAGSATMRTPPPRHPSQRAREAPLPPLPARSAQDFATLPSRMPQAAHSDFAQEFYAAGTGESVGLQFEAMTLGSGPGPSSAQASTSRTPLTSSTSSSAPIDSGLPRPTTTPQAGHPLLHKGQILFYPAGVQCKKCYNTGYQRFDPSRPCSRCWRNYGRPYSGPLLLASTGAFDTHADPSSSSSSIQRPLPTNFGLSASAGEGGAGGDPALEPTAMPQHGHPLMHKNKVLWYPSGYTCDKCFNTGFKRFDPSKPCSRCWKAFGRGTELEHSASFWAAQGLVLQRPLSSNSAMGYPVADASSPSTPGPSASSAFLAAPATSRRLSAPAAGWEDAKFSRSAQYV
ncbi:unnamed protein product [Mycena citricolor]|uniref:Uncharacterized protein n=1 Tax=Mycena citricolor TaxID=2018698 RepID=A0AAD2Q7I6_9AGAR|nr:unnamed protein product [Mycena citricolor]